MVAAGAHRSEEMRLNRRSPQSPGWYVAETDSHAPRFSADCRHTPSYLLGRVINQLLNRAYNILFVVLSCLFVFIV